MKQHKKRGDILDWRNGILIVSGDKKLACTISRELGDAQYEVHYETDGEKGLRIALEKQFDLIVLDWTLPKKSGLTVLKELREHKNLAQILMLTAEDSVREVILSLDSGANACEVKTSGIQVLKGRVKALIRRRQWDRGAEILSAHIHLDPVTHKVWRGRIEIELTAKEYDLLVYFMRNTRIVLTREMIAQNVWNDTLSSSHNSVTVYVNYLRKKIGNGADQKLIHTVKGVGYTFIGDIMSQSGGNLRTSTHDCCSTQPRKEPTMKSSCPPLPVLSPPSR